MFFRKPQTVICAVCEKPIERKERRFVEKNRVTEIDDPDAALLCAGYGEAPYVVQLPAVRRAVRGAAEGTDGPSSTDAGRLTSDGLRRVSERS